MINLFKLIFVLTFSFGFLVIIFAGSRSKALTSLKLKEKKRLSIAIEDALLIPFSLFLSGFIRFTEDRRILLQRKLDMAELDISPELYYARGVSAAAVMLLFIPFTIVLGSYYLAPIIIIVALMSFFHFTNKANVIITQKREVIENALPSFIRAIVNKMTGSDVVAVDLIEIFRDYHKVADDAFKHDVGILIVDMETQDVETGIRRFENRLGVLEVTHLCNALISMSQGNDQSLMLFKLASDMDVKTRENNQRMLDKLPGKVILACMPLVVVGVITLFVTLLTHVMYLVGDVF